MRDNFHSRMVAWLKVLLPLAALAVLSTLFLVARTIDPELAIPYARVDIEDRLREPRMTQPLWSGVTSDGAAVTVRADVARPATGTTGATADGMLVNLAAPDGEKTELRAREGALDSGFQVLTVTGDVVITTSSGWRLESQQMTAVLDRSRIESPEPVAITGPIGRIDAGQMEMLRQEAPDSPYLLRFTGGVKLLYEPKS